MRILITSGGTKIPIDRVRSITNMSNGTFGSQIADSFIANQNNGADGVIFIRAKGSKLPPSINADQLKNGTAFLDKGYFYSRKYETFSDYQDILYEELGPTMKPDIIILAAAVSDYGVAEPVDGKIRSKEDLTILLKPLPKIISGVRERCPNAIICGFKLLVDSNKDELISAAQDSIRDNGLDLVVANDLSTIENEDHSLHIVEPNWNAEFFRSKHNLATVVRDYCMYHHHRRSAQLQKKTIA